MEENKKSAPPKKLRLWGIKSDSVANGMGQVGVCLPYDAVVCLRQACFFSAEPTFLFISCHGSPRLWVGIVCGCVLNERAVKYFAK